MAALWRGYLRLLETHTFKVQVASAGVLIAIGDCCSQQIVERRGRQHDFKRTLGMASIGIFIVGPAMRYWYILLDSVIKGSRTVDAMKKVAMDQTIFAPCIIATFFGTTSLLFGKTQAEIKAKFANQYFDTLKTNYLIWPLVQTINFNFVPLQHRVFVVNFVAIFWNTYLSWAANKEEVDDEHIKI
ncbi:protein Mpv17-like [Dendronephthya gigantea]|uniref:protein Mpv17-like n=1 Tax=Dendronephthya gigantea TaxID=151771 RepID=UPI00106BF2FC|nr:protein Mpv17-like [Dendronephthya gigantea]